MFKYVLKRIGYMFLVLFILSIVIFMIYNLTPSNRAYTDAKADQVAMKQQLAGMSAEAQAKWFEERYEMYQISYGTETNNMILRYLRCIPMRITPTLARKASSMASCRATSAILISIKKM